MPGLKEARRRREEMDNDPKSGLVSLHDLLEQRGEEGIPSTLHQL